MERTVEAKGLLESYQMPKCRKEKHRIHWATGKEEEMMVLVSTYLTRTTGKVSQGIIPALSSIHRVRTTYTVDCGHHQVHPLKAKLYTYANTLNFIVIDLSSSIFSISVKSKWTRSTNTLHWLTSFQSPVTVADMTNQSKQFCLMRWSQSLWHSTRSNYYYPMRKTGTHTENHLPSFMKVTAIISLHLSSSW